VIHTSPAHGGDECPYKTSRTCSTQVCPTPFPTSFPTASPTPPPTPPYSKPYFNKGTMSYVEEANLKGGTVTHYDGIECHDKVWGDLTKSIKTTGAKLDFTKVGHYELKYDCRNPAPWSIAADPIKVIVDCVDTQPPLCVAKSVVRMEASFPYTPTGAACTDNMDGKLTGVKITGDKIDVEKANDYSVTYSATDKSGNVGTFIQTVTIVDTLKPTIGLKFGGTVVHAGPALDRGVQGEKNPAHGYYGSFMAEAATSSTMTLAAAAAATMGVALIAVSLRRSTDDSVIAELV